MVSPPERPPAARAAGRADRPHRRDRRQRLRVRRSGATSGRPGIVGAVRRPGHRRGERTAGGGGRGPAVAEPSQPAAVVSSACGSVRCWVGDRPGPERGRSASSATMAATLERPWPGSVERARRTSASRSEGPVSGRALLAVAGGQTGEARLEQGAQRGDVAVDGAGRRGHGPQADQPVGAEDDVLGLRPPTARPTRCASATPSASRRSTVRTSRSGIGPRVSRSASVSPSIHSLTT